MAVNKYIIVRDDLMQDPVTIVTDGLLIGRLYECELLLNHPAVSRAQAGIRRSDDDFYLFNLRPSNPVKLNGKVIERNSALAAGDILEMGPFLLEIDQTDDALILKVSLHIGMVVIATDFLGPHIDTSTLVLPDDGSTPKKSPPKPRPAPLPGDKALDIFWEKRIREAGKVVKTSILFPLAKRKVGKAQFNWAPTSDLLSRWPKSVFVWSTVVVGLLSVSAAFWFTSAFAPAPISNAHAKSSLGETPPIAVKANANSCTNCHNFRSNMESNCASCHNADGFMATVIEPHAAAGVGCVSCHAEHRGQNFKAAEAALGTCTDCHNDTNRESYNGRRVSTPHGGTFGYPVMNGSWKWEGLTNNDWQMKQIAIERTTTDTDEQWRSNQFHALHVHRVRARSGEKANAEGELSCSSCHKTSKRIDRETPRTTCGGCHNGYLEPKSQRVLIAADKPNCISCHVQHVKSKKHWGAPMLSLDSR
ncbi:MAG TPA: FHA domain-containing protein [Pyrinomonadaceae bacterium]|nr:FHA domain-containing protein [Pyrinomonadaceae bacterium]